MEFVGFMVVALIAGAVIFAFQQHAVTSPGRELAEKFASLGTIAGRSREEIESVVGPPTSFSAVGDGSVLLQWQATGYHIALVFTDNVCGGVTHEYMHQG